MAGPKLKAYYYKMNKSWLMPPGAQVEGDVICMKRLLRPKEIKKYDLVDLNEGFKKLTIYRSSIEMTQRELAEQTGIPLKTIQRWELVGLNEGKAISAVKIADVLKCSVKDLMEDEN